MVTTNLETDLDIANGARGIISGIVRNPAEPPLGDGDVVELKYMPAYILVKLDHTRATGLAGLEDQVIPIKPLSRTFEIRTRVNREMQTRREVRQQFPMTAAYAFTDYRAQGQTILYVTVDIRTPPRGGLLLFNLYVALSRSTGRAWVRLLRDFNDNLFLQAQAAPLFDEDDRL